MTPDTAISDELVQKIAHALTSLPDGFKPLRQIEKLIRDRKAAFFDKKELGWGEGELLAYGSLLAEGKIVRMSGQDVKRGTFTSHLMWLIQRPTSPCQLNYIARANKILKFLTLFYQNLLS